MAHELENSQSMFYVGEKPWHGLGVEYKTPPGTAAEAVVAAGLNWNVELRPMFVPSRELLNAKDRDAVPAKNRGIKVEGQFGVVRSSDERVLGVVGKKYTALQNSEAFAFLDPIVSEGDATFETAGSLKGGSVVWALLRMQRTFEVVPGDAVRSYMLVTNSHDGSRLVQARFIPIRVVCWNTLSAASPSRASRDKDADADAAVRIRHTATVTSRTGEAVDLLHKLYKSSVQTEEICKTLASSKISPKVASDFIESLFSKSGGEEIEGAREEMSSKTENIVEEVLRYAQYGKGSQIPGVRGTKWGVYNAITEYVSHSQGLPKDKRKSITRGKAEAHLQSVWLGTGQKFVDDALKKLVLV